MKMIHCADIHLGSKMDSKLPRDKADIRRGEVRQAFSRMVDYAGENGIRYILMSGDVFDSDRPLKKDKVFFYNVIRANPDITFCYLHGNHDIQSSYTEEDIPNLKVFSDYWHSFEVDDGIAIMGIDLSDDNLKSALSALTLKRERINIVMLHGAVHEGERDNHINLARLRNKSIDYLALGHIHSYEAKPLDDRGIYVYSGCLEGRGFDEAGPKGFVVIDITDGVVTHTFHKNSARIIDEYTVDVSGVSDTYTATRHVKEQITARAEDLVRINLTGEVSFDNEDLAEDVREALERDHFFVSVKDKTVHSPDLSCMEGDVSLRAEFIRTVMANCAYSEGEKKEIISIGLKALAGRDLT